MRRGETREVHRGDDDNGDDGARRRRIITLKLQCPNFLKASHNQILLDKTELKNVLEREKFRDLQPNPNSYPYR